MSKGSRNRTKNLNQYRERYDQIVWSDSKNPKTNKIVVGVNLSKNAALPQDIIQRPKDA